ncbi:MAG: protein tyrosine phosphatase [Flavobacteriales bacterium]|nr:MAG: protein tyrosine phosphatase [Flavobacteriales bacterium]
MSERPEKRRILFVCTVNRLRSATAHKIYENDPRFDVDSAGTDRTATVVLEEWHLEWADAVVVMEKRHRNTIRDRFPEWYEKKPIVCLCIEDIYDFMQPELVAILKDKFEDVLRRGLLGA